MIETQTDLDMYWKLETKSTWANQSVIVLGGIIDKDYRGEISAYIHNLNPPIKYRANPDDPPVYNEPIVIKASKAVCQMIPSLICPPNYFRTGEVQRDTARGSAQCGQVTKEPLVMRPRGRYSFALRKTTPLLSSHPKCFFDEDSP